MQTDYISYIRYWIEENFSDDKSRHIFGVCETAKSLARHYNADENKAEVAALFHDMFKDITDEELKDYAKNLGLEEKYQNNINLAHSKIAAAIMASDYNISDEDILNAVKYHTTGRVGMSLLEKIIFIADVIEPGRDYPGVEEVRELVYKDLAEACLTAMKNSVEYVRAKGNFIDEDTLEAIDWFKSAFD